MVSNPTSPKKGESLIELVLAMAIFAAILPTVLFAIGSVNQSEPQRNNYFNSTLITEETKNIVQQIKNNNWNDIPANGEYVLTGSGTVWTWTNVTSYGVGTPIPTTRDGLTRTVTVADALRTVGGALTDVVSGSVVDAATKKITINTTWPGAAAPASSVVYMSRNNAIQTATFTTTGDFQAGGQVTNGTAINTPTPGDDGSITTTNANPSKPSSLVSWWSMDAYVVEPTLGVSWIADNKSGGNNSAIVYPLTLSGTPAPTLANSRFGKSIQLNITGVPVQPIAWYKMDETSWNGTVGEVVNSVPNGVSGTASGGATTTSAGKYGYSSNLDGSNDYVNLGDNFDFNYTDARTICAWINPTSIAPAQTIVGKSNWNSPYDGWLFSIRAGGYLQFDYVVSWSGNAVSYQTTSVVLSPDTWQHVCIVYNNKAMTFYKDGVSYPTTVIVNTAISSINNAKNLNIGGRDNGSGWMFSGKIDDVRVYDYARTSDQIATDMAGTSTLLNETNVAHLQVIYNSSNMNLGASNHAMSWEYTIKPTGTTTKPVIEWWTLGTTPTPTVGAQGWLLGGSGTDIFTDLKPPSGTAQHTNATQIVDAKFNHVVMSYNGSTISHHLNGALVNTSSAVTGTPPSTALPLSIGYRYPGSYFVGEIDDVAIYNAALTAQEAHDSLWASFTSAVKDFGHGQAPQMLSLYAEVTKPTDTDIQVRVASRGAYTDGSDICPTSESEYTFVGPLGTGAGDDYFVVSGSSISGNIFSGTTGNYVNPGRCLRYKVYFKSLNAFPSGAQPTFNSIRFTYAL